MLKQNGSFGNDDLVTLSNHCTADARQCSFHSGTSKTRKNSRHIFYHREVFHTQISLRCRHNDRERRSPHGLPPNGFENFGAVRNAESVRVRRYATIAARCDAERFRRFGPPAARRRLSSPGFACTPLS